MNSDHAALPAGLEPTNRLWPGPRSGGRTDDQRNNHHLRHLAMHAVCFQPSPERVRLTRKECRMRRPVPEPVPAYDNTAFAGLFNQYKERLGLSWEQLHEQTGISTKQLHRYSKGAGTPTWIQLQKLVSLAERYGHHHHLFVHADARAFRSYRLKLEDRKGVLAHIAMRIAENDGSIRKSEIRTFEDDQLATLELAVVFDRSPVEMLDQLAHLPHVKEVADTTERP
jgi:hypothetical protein